MACFVTSVDGPWTSEVIEGTVNAFCELVVPLSLRGATGQTLEVEAVIDTGYNGLLTLPSSTVTELGLPRRGYGETSLPMEAQWNSTSTAARCSRTAVPLCARTIDEQLDADSPRLHWSPATLSTQVSWVG